MNTTTTLVQPRKLQRQVSNFKFSFEGLKGQTILIVEHNEEPFLPINPHNPAAYEATLLEDANHLQDSATVLLLTTAGMIKAKESDLIFLLKY